MRPFVAANPKKKTKVNIELMKDRVFMFLCGIGLCSAFGFYVPLFYVPGELSQSPHVYILQFAFRLCTE